MACFDLLVSETAHRAADVINRFERKYNERYGAWPISAGSFKIGLQAQTCEVVLVLDE
jgi:hypothetical protein